MVESVWKHFSKKICFCCNISSTSYSHCLSMLNRKSLEYRRVEFDLMFMYKIIHGYVNLNFSDFFSVCQSAGVSKLRPAMNFCLAHKSLKQIIEKK